MMAVICYHHQLPIPLNAVHNDSYLTERQPPLVPNDIQHLSLLSDSGVPIDVTNGSDFGLELDLTIGHGFNLGSSSLVYPFVNGDFDFNPYPRLEKMKTS